MDGSAVVSDSSRLNGVEPDGSTAGPGNTDTRILQALELVHDPRSSNHVRQQASQYLQEIKSQNEAPYYGFGLASNKSCPAIAQHYGLSLLEDAIRHKWTDYSEAQSIALREWTLKLAQDICEQDPLYVRNKIAQLWVEIAKRSWALNWMDMDECLVELWGASIPHKELVLTILETLSDNTFGREDTSAGLRSTELSKACVEIFTPAAVLIENFPARETNVNVRFGQEGWLSRISDLLGWYGSQGWSDTKIQPCAVRALSALRSVCGWAIIKAVATSQCVPRMCECLAATNLAVQLAAIEALYTLYSRPRFSNDDFHDIVCPLYEHETIRLLKSLYEWSTVEAQDIDDDRYLLSKKLSEMVYSVGGFLEENTYSIPPNIDLTSFLDLLISIVRSESLHVSIPILHLWAKLLSSDAVGKTPAIINFFAPLLEICSQRIIRYEALPEDSNHPSIIFLNEDVDTVPERHAFLGNYARFCNQILESIVQKQPFDALYHILGQADQVLNHLYEGESPFQVESYTKTSVPLLRLDAQFSVVEASLKGYARWLASPKATNSEHQKEVMNSNLETWCTRLLELTFEDPMIKQRTVQLAFEFAVRPLKRKQAFVLKVFEFILNTRSVDAPNVTAYSDAVKELQLFCLHQLRQLSMKAPDLLAPSLDAIERKIDEICHSATLDNQTRDRFYSVLFIIIHRANNVDAGLRGTRLKQFLEPAVSQWQSDHLTNALTSFSGFFNLLEMNSLQQYYKTRAVHQIENWSAHPLDQEGKTLQKRMQDALEASPSLLPMYRLGAYVHQRLPLRATKSHLSVTIEKLDSTSRPYVQACALWSGILPLILPNLLQLTSYSHAFHDPANWTDLPPEMKGIVGRTLTDRFWQVGISSGSREDFYNRVGGTKDSLEGLASSIRATVRFVRETSYRILFHMSQLGEQLYAYEELPEPLAKALFADACALSSHQMAILVEMIRPVIENCPAPRRAKFLPPILISFFTQLDRKIGSEWSSIEERTKAASAEDDLADEMRDESILRQLTFSSVLIVVNLLDPNRVNPKAIATASDNVSTSSEQRESDPPESTMRSFILETPSILKPVILFCTHALEMHDTRSCGIITRVLRSLIQDFLGTAPVAVDVREFISNEVLKACITSLHDPYFVDTQSDLAQLIASIVVMYSGRTETPRKILLSLPEMRADKVDRTILRLCKAQHNNRQQRALVLDLLESLRGVSVGEQGRLPKPDPKKVRSAMQERYMNVDNQPGVRKEQSPDLGGIADMFG